MAMILESNQACPLASQCPYHTGQMGPCYGAKADRPNKFECEHVVGGRIVEGGTKIPGDQTGKQQVILG